MTTDDPLACQHCQETRVYNTPDPCLGMLDGVSYACCGHNRFDEEEYAYVCVVTTTAIGSEDFIMHPREVQAALLRIEQPWLQKMAEAKLFDEGDTLIVQRSLSKDFISSALLGVVSKDGSIRFRQHNSFSAGDSRMVQHQLMVWPEYIAWEPTWYLDPTDGLQV